jgi:hypothetical protein
VIAQAHRDGVRAPYVPAALQRVGLAMGSAMGRVMGYTAGYEPQATVVGEAVTQVA